MTTWTQKGFAVISDVAKTAVPLVHGFETTQWEAEGVVKKSKELLLSTAPDLLLNLRVVPAELTFET